jgi:hypothetical protein
MPKDRALAAMHVGQAEISSLEPVRQLGVVDPQAVAGIVCSLAEKYRDES